MREELAAPIEQYNVKYIFEFYVLIQNSHFDNEKGVSPPLLLWIRFSSLKFEAHCVLSTYEYLN